MYLFKNFSSSFLISLERTFFGSHSVSQFRFFSFPTTASYFFIALDDKNLFYFFVSRIFFLMILFRIRKLDFTLDLSNFPLLKTFISFIFNFHDTHFPFLPTSIRINEQVLFTSILESIEY